MAGGCGRERRAPRLILAAILVVAALAVAATALAASIRECGYLRHLIHGYQQVVNVTSRNVPCPVARETASQIEKQVLYRSYGSEWGKAHLRSHWFHWQGWTMHTRWYHKPGLPAYFISQDVRSTASRGRVIYYQVVGE